MDQTSLGSGEIIIEALATPTTLAGLFHIIRAWIELKRSSVIVHCQVGEINIDVEMDSSSNIEHLVEYVLTSVHHGTTESDKKKRKPT